MLAEAVALLEKGDEEGALRALLEAWRSERHTKTATRIADAIDLLSERLTQARGPITGRNKAERAKAWLAVEQKKDPADVGRLLAARWLPDRAADAVPLAKRLAAWPADPRIAMGLARVFDATPYETQDSWKFYCEILARIGEIGDTRALQILGVRARGSFRFRTDNAERKTVELLRQRERESAAKGAEAVEASQLLDRLDVALRGSHAQQAEHARREAALLAAIHAAPDDDAPRAVYADFLAESGATARSELIGLQLKRAASPEELTPAMARREKELLAANGDVWCGPPGKWLEREGRVFERGFLAQGRLRLPPGGFEEPGIFTDPSWSTLRSIELEGDREDCDAMTASILEAPTLTGLRALHGLSSAGAGACGRSDKTIEEVTVRVDQCFDAASLEPLLGSRGSKWLRRFGVLAGPQDDLAWIAKSGVLERLERLTIASGSTGLASWLAMFAEQDHSVETFVYYAVPLVRISEPTDLRFTFTEREGRAFRSLRIELLKTDRDWRDIRNRLETELRALAPAGLRSIVIAPSRSLKPDARDRALLDAAIAAHASCTDVRVPWRKVPSRARTAPGTAPSSRDDVLPAAGPASTLVLDFEGDDVFRNLDGFVGTLDAAGLRLGFDSFQLDEGAWHPLAGGMSRVMTRIHKAIPRRLEPGASYRKSVEVVLRRDSLEGVRRLTLRSWGRSTSLALESDGFTTPEDVARWRAWLDVVLERWSVRHGAWAQDASWLGGPIPLSWLDNTTANVSWITVLGEQHERLLPKEELAKLGPLVALRTTKRNVVLEWSPSPLTPADPKAISALLVPLFLARFRATYGYELRERLESVIAPVLKASFGMTAGTWAALTGNDGGDALDGGDAEAMSRRFTVVKDDFVRSIEIALSRPLAGPRLSVSVILNRGTNGKLGPYLAGTQLKNPDDERGYWPAGSRDEIDASLRTIADRLRNEGEKLFAEREKKHRAGG